MISSKVGSPVTGKDFFNREIEQQQIWEYLEGDDLLLLSPRRVGKTSVMFRLRDTAADHGFEAAYLSVAGAEDEVGFVRKLYEAASKLESAPGTLKRLGQGPLGRLLKRFKRRQRLKEELGQPDATLAGMVLGAAAADRRGVSKTNLEQLLAARIREPEERRDRLGFLLDVLVSDGYLVEDRGRYLFLSPLLRDFWRRRVSR